VFRNEKPGPGRFRQFMQFDADTVGSASPAADAEMCMMAADTMEALGIPRGQYVVKVNNRKVLDGIREALRVDDDAKWLTVMRAIDKVDRLGAKGVSDLLREGREDESGDFTKGANLSDSQVELVVWFVGGAHPRFNSEQSYYQKYNIADLGPTEIPNYEKGFLEIDNQERIDRLRYIGRNVAVFQQGLDELEVICGVTASAGYDCSLISFDPSVVRGLEYYTGPVYEVELLPETKEGRPVRFGSVGGGGRYDGLVSRFRGEPVPATGFSIGVSRLQAALALIGKSEAKPAYGPVIVTVFGGDIADYQKFVAALRNAGIRAELYLGNPKHSLGQQLKYADKRNSPCAIIQGGNEKAAGQLIVRDLVGGKELANDERTRDEHLQKQAEAQRTVPESEMLDTVRAVLARHNASWG
jgi:histidyl-tRNA synthetase